MAAEQEVALNLLSSNYDVIAALPANVKKRVCALKKLQLESIKIESEFYRRVHELELEFEQKFKPFFDARRAIVTGEKEPTEAECDASILEGISPEQAQTLANAVAADPSATGIKDFWLNALKTHDLVAESIEEHDLPILSFLIDVTTTGTTDPMGFKLEFHFATNPYFKNSVLTKTYVLDFEPEEEALLSFDGPHVVRVIGDTIDWVDGKNVTKKAVKKKQKKGANAGKFLTKTVKADSFFNFFDPPKSKDERNEDEDDEQAEEFLELDYELGQALRDTVIARAVLFYTGELQSDDMFDFPGEDDEEGPSDFSDDDE
uniref:Nucleosome assembly protein 1-like 1 n=1 Tax=Caenorhabditis tropicalis TaxID=1561998 RepID=A0A1I7ULU5_9PELO